MSPSTVDYRDLKRRNAELNHAELVRGEPRLASLPRYVLVELTQGCNLRCPMCRPDTIRYAERPMPRDLLTAVAEVLFPTAEMVDVRGWGESLLAPDIGAILDLVDRYRARCRLVTNLSLGRREVLDQLVALDAMVDVSLDAADQAALDRARTGARLPVIDRNLRHLVGAMHRVHGTAAALRIVATVQRSTVDSIVGLVEYAAELGVPSIVLNAVTLAPGDPKSLQGLDERVDAAIAAAAGRAAALGVALYAGTRFGRTVGIDTGEPFCIHPFAYAAIGYDGSVGYCDHLLGPMMPFAHMGSVGVEGFREIWNGEKWQRLRRWHATGHPADDERYRVCADCYQLRNVDFEQLFEPTSRRYRLAVSPLPHHDRTIENEERVHR